MSPNGLMIERKLDTVDSHFQSLHHEFENEYHVIMKLSRSHRSKELI